MADQPSHIEGGLFSQTRICIIRSHKLDNDVASKLSSTIEERGGEVVIHQSPTPLPPISEFTHLVSSTIDFPGHDSACDALIPVVKPQWVHASASKNKLANPRQYNPDPRLFLNDVLVSCADIPEGDKDAIIGGVLAMGGLYTARLTSSTTHLVALNMDTDKCRQAAGRLSNLKIVLPHWFDDCLKLGKRIDERPYMLPDPEILRARCDDPIKGTTNKDIIGASTPEPRYLLSADEVRDDLNVFDGKSVMISSDLKIGERLLQCLETLIVKGGGRIAYDVGSADIYVGRYREGEDYQVASRAGKEVGNLSWLYHLITRNTWISPLRRLLHYPVSRSGIPGFNGLKISLSNYSGEARIYLENLIVAAGAECTKSLRQDNTHLITAHGNSEKCTAAREWNLHVVNHLWLEDSYAKWQMQTVTNPRYTHFPQRTNLGEIVGQTQIDKFAIEEHFFPREEDAATNKNTPPSVVQQKENNVCVSNVKKQPEKTTTAKQLSTLGSSTPQGTTESKPTTKRDRLSLQTPHVSRFIAEGKENDTPSTTGSRKSKDVATARLQDLAPDMILYEREKRRAGGVIYGGRRKSDDGAVVSRKRSIEPDETTDTETKKQKKTRPQVSMHLLITGYSPWVGNARQEDNDRRILRDLGIMVVQDASKCSHLAAPSILKTQKFVNALAYAPKIINCDFITDCVKKDELLDPNKYKLRDKKSEKKYEFSLDQALQRAEKNQNRLLQGRTIFCVETIHGGFDVFKSIIETNGGQCAMYRGRPLTIAGRRGADGGEAHKEEVYLISGGDKSHVKLWPRFQTMVQDARKVPKIVRTDWLLEIAMSQEWRWKDEYEWKEEDLVASGN
ncbi:hypothetical protein D8B26_006740 [Coccidioides posadasii str. Silveira]|uniref:DNA repair protein Rtt107 n=1 Tax=Coccidioides posadasii (strain RMSCC 757 / Silveira) TaxID=443226 RepID=E9CRG1_COCPS|nr:DNA repair protein Rtt107 [Coccidioides posadasii str. Silveira]QVM12104.1 hypothetical protein D8B26_006740 [Coccidioides posadasii str. Silveira]